MLKFHVTLNTSSSICVYYWYWFTLTIYLFVLCVFQSVINHFLLVYFVVCCWKHSVKNFTLKNTVLSIDASTNDIMNTTSQELLEKYKRMIQRYKCRSNKMIISGILHRSSAPNTTFSTKCRLKSICTDKVIDFINCWDEFNNKNFLFLNDDLHFNPIEADWLGQLLSNKVSDFSFSYVDNITGRITNVHNFLIICLFNINTLRHVLKSRSLCNRRRAPHCWRIEILDKDRKKDLLTENYLSNYSIFSRELQIGRDVLI